MWLAACGSADSKSKVNCLFACLLIQCDTITDVNLSMMQPAEPRRDPLFAAAFFSKHWGLGL